ncbi:hypothetical protein AGABI1DRAFT_111997 [Agaricus bisporus var. burnettii JB137-S8]|uniref:GH16 domain-containing protein n=1 Tax=Agaricus bisporus var. burnettii (strain JB137-S8 / ATCC MYA-4627 / FGSC 10392) TaxID=597362 RepID=K5Y1P7_AGABU|nr:uncharacterized protein AGABI1DRAFT_111997 [Agaricus bisporus var. burnettii JB137-S8]EKM81740.1 hypothetical protein AGABI1DRAFT_111997 [Agaricus bisporus var. burnettii JB137-S8]
MRFYYTLIATFLPAFALAGKSYDTHLRSRHASRAAGLRIRADDTYVPNATVSNGNPPYHRHEHYEGESFFKDWDFFTGEDPTHGNVNYQSLSNAQRKQLAYVKDGVTVLAVDNSSSVPVGGKRDSVRITTKKTWNFGLFIADFAYMPWGCGIWPAYWSVGPDWPNAGEIDILEGVNNQTWNQYTIHTGIECVLPDNNAGIDALASPMGKTCTSSNGANSGCGYQNNNPNSYGAGFNAAGGGVLVHEWNSWGVKIWFFTRDSIPVDITNEQPNPTSWGTPTAAWPSRDCDFSSALYEHSLVIDTTLCGDWAGSAYGDSGCPGTCQEVVANPANFANAQWGVNYISVYQS